MPGVGVVTEVKDKGLPVVVVVVVVKETEIKLFDVGVVVKVTEKGLPEEVVVVVVAKGTEIRLPDAVVAAKVSEIRLPEAECVGSDPQRTDPVRRSVCRGRQFRSEKIRSLFSVFLFRPFRRFSVSVTFHK